MTVIIGNHKIDYKDSGAVLYTHGKFIKGFASDETKKGLSGLEKAKQFINSKL